jgi:hypothetical protein
MAVIIQFRRGTAAAWTSANPTLAEGEVGYETDTGKHKIGDGSTAWTSLDYVVTGLSDAPSDGTQYARLDGAWAAVAASGGGLTWTTTGTGATMTAGNGYVVTAAVTMTLPASLTAGDEIVVHASGADVTVDPATHSIEGAGATVTSSDTLTIADGQTAHLVAETTSLMRIV